MTSASEQAGQILAEALAAALRDSDDGPTALHNTYQQLVNAGIESKLTVHRYVCRRGCGVLMTVVKSGKDTLARTRDYKYSPGKNLERSVPEARRKRTLDGDHHWPGHTFDVGHLAPQEGMDANCRHSLHTVMAADVLAAVEGVRPGHPGKPTLL